MKNRTLLLFAAGGCFLFAAIDIALLANALRLLP